MTMLEKEINNRKVITYVNGNYSFDKRSNLYNAITESGLAIEDKDKKYTVAVGAKRQYKTMGYKMAIVEI